MTEASKTEMLEKKIARRTQLLEQQANIIETPEQYLDVVSDRSERKLILRFLRNPVELLPSEEDPNKLGTVKLQRMKL